MLSLQKKLILTLQILKGENFLEVLELFLNHKELY